MVSWARDKQKTDRELSFPELLRDLVYVLPSDLLLIVYDSNHKPVLDALQGFSVNSNPVEVSFYKIFHDSASWLVFKCIFEKDVA